MVRRKYIRCRWKPALPIKNTAVAVTLDQPIWYYYPATQVIGTMCLPEEVLLLKASQVYRRIHCVAPGHR